MFKNRILNREDLPKLSPRVLPKVSPGEIQVDPAEAICSPAPENFVARFRHSGFGAPTIWGYDQPAMSAVAGQVFLYHTFCGLKKWRGEARLGLTKSGRASAEFRQRYPADSQSPAQIPVCRAAGTFFSPVGS